MLRRTREEYLFVAFLVAGVGFNLGLLFERYLYTALFVGHLILLILLGGAFSVLFVWAVVRKRGRLRWLVALVAFAIATPIVVLYNPEWFRADTMLRARLTDDLNYLDLRIRKDGSCTTEAVGLFAFAWTFHGRCEIRGDEVLFHRPPYDADLFPRIAPILDGKLILRFEKGQPDTSVGMYFSVTYRRGN